MSIRRNIGDKIKNWISNSPVVEKGIESIVDKTKAVIAEDMNEPISPETEWLIDAGLAVGGIILLAVLTKQKPKAKDIAEPVFRTITINNYYR